MKLFDYDKPGKGFDVNAPKKKGAALFFDILCREFGKLAMVNLIFILACIPVVTAGAAYAGLCRVIFKIIQDEPVDVWYDFKQGFVSNWKQASLAYFITALGAAIIGNAVYFYYQNFPPIFYVGLMIGVALVMLNNFVMPIIVLVQLPMKMIYKNSFYLSALAVKNSFAAMVLLVANVWLGALTFPLSGAFFILIGVSLYTLINGLLTFDPIAAHVMLSSTEEDAAS